MTKVVVVESPAKAKTINKYLGKDYKVVASYGHIRDLPSKNGSVDPDEGFAMQWSTESKSEKNIKDIVSALKGADELILATDPDREGEAISWHIKEVLEERKKLKNVDVKRVVFNRITKNAVLHAMENPREIDQKLVDAYLARRALDYLVGFTLSPVLWRKLPGSKSAGRVQSVALRLICERESEIEAFIVEEYWGINVDFKTPNQDVFTSRLIKLNGENLGKFSIANEQTALGAKAAIDSSVFHVEKIERSKAKRNPYPPFITSTMQQDAAHRLHFSAKKTMQVAQRLYEVGLITYMRTDSVQMDGGAINSVREMIASAFGDKYLPSSPRMYKTKAKNAQEGHEAIRPTEITKTPKVMAGKLDTDQYKLYELIWKRTVACQMQSAEMDKVTVDSASDDKTIVLRANGSIVSFDGFLKLYKDHKKDDGDSRILPAMDEDDALVKENVDAIQHFTKPPARFSEASLVKKLEELGIGRPSTYASIIDVLQTRKYVRLESRRFMPEDRGRIVTAFLEDFFNQYVQYNFTADLEEQLDDISHGSLEWKGVLEKFWEGFTGAVAGTKDLTITQVLDSLNETLGAHFFPAREDGGDPRECPSCKKGKLSLKVGKFGGFIGCSKYPDCKYTRQLSDDEDENGENGLGGNGITEIGIDKATGLMITLRKGPYGHYLQLGEETPPEKGKKKGKKPKRISIPRTMAPSEVNMQIAEKLMSLPREIGAHPETGEIITANLGPFGPYVKMGEANKSLQKQDNILDIGLERAVELLSTVKPIIVIGEHPKDSKPVTLREGRWGSYVKHGKIQASIPKSKQESGAITLEYALELLDAKAGSADKKKPAAKKAPVKKKPAAKKKAPAKKKPVAKKE
ncbi:MAG: type I DNA topoisomerase [Alphaproteobacteria bacterium]|nr:type I DNA topoisomerase [Alphaproteobacteria bacterium]